MEIRLIAETDHGEVRAFLLRQVSFASLNEKTPEQFCEEIERDIAAPETVSFVVYEDGQLVAIIDMLPKHPRDGSLWLGLFLVDETLWGRGFGTRVYETFEKEQMHPLQWKFRLGVLPHNERARRFWTRLGYVYEKDAKTGDGVSVQVMKKEVGSIF